MMIMAEDEYSQYYIVVSSVKNVIVAVVNLLCIYKDVVIGSFNVVRNNVLTHCQVNWNSFKLSLEVDTIREKA